MKILLVEDEIELLKEVRTFLQNQQYLCETATTFAEAEDKVSLYRYDAVVLDIGLPGGSGLTILEMLKKIQPETGVLIVSAKNSLDDKIHGLSIGADDYITKPFHLAELHARLHALLRRKNFNGSSEIQFEELRIDPQSKTARHHDTTLPLTPKEYELLEYLALNPNRVLSKQDLTEHLWGDNYDMVDNYDFLYVHIKNLRKKLQTALGEDHLKTVYGLGYKLTSS